jgi:hypothetical protein
LPVQLEEIAEFTGGGVATVGRISGLTGTAAGNSGIATSSVGDPSSAEITIGGGVASVGGTSGLAGTITHERCVRNRM